MKITLSKRQWELVGKKAGWIKAAASGKICSYCGNEISDSDETDKYGEMHRKCELAAKREAEIEDSIGKDYDPQV